MRRFFVLVKKEIRELLTPQFLLPLIITVLIFSSIGKIAGKENEKSQQPQPILVSDQDGSVASRQVLHALAGSNLKLEMSSEKDESAIIAEAKRKQLKAAIIIGPNFEEQLKNGQGAELKSFAVFTGFSLFGTRTIGQVSGALASLNSVFNPSALLTPVKITPQVIIGEKISQTDAGAVMGFVSTQTTFIPIVLFLVITISAQLIAVSMATEKENKTLETLLSLPVSRNAIVASKLIAAGIVSLLSAIVYIFGMRSYLSGLTGESGSGLNEQVISDLGLSFSSAEYLLLGAVLFLGILVALSIAVILGAFAEDTKSAQAVVAPLMILLLIPYLLSLFFDLNAVSPALRILLYLIPFTHAFQAAPNLLLDNFSAVIWGMVYMAGVFAVFVFIAGKLFASEKLLTLKLKFRRRT